MALTLYLILAILSSWIWVDYFKNIGLADTNKKAYRYLMFALGAAAYYLFHIIANKLLGGFEISWQNKILGNSIEITFTHRRPGDPAELISDPKKAEREIGWKSKLNLETMIKDSISFFRATSHHNIEDQVK